MSNLAQRCGLAAIAVSVALPAAGNAQRSPYAQYFANGNEMYQPPDFHGNPPYDGRFTFARIRYRGYEHWAGREGPGWAHDYPDAEENFAKILRDVTAIRPFVEEGPIVGSVLVSLDDPLLFKYPVSYMSEPGGWHPNDKELDGFRRYIEKGGFMIFDDFREVWRRGPSGDWSHLKELVAQVMPKAKWVQLTGHEPIFDAFFKIDMNAAVVWPSTSAYGDEPPTYWAVYQDNDPTKRMIMIANVDNDIGESWQWSGTGFVPVSQSNEIFKLGINYVIYALTH